MNCNSHNKSKSTNPGFTLVELLIVIAIIGILVGMTLPAVNTIRESARLSQCKNNLRQMALASENYRSARRSFPAGTLGFAEQFDFDLERDWLNPVSEYFWKNAQHTSFGVQLLPYIELQSVYDLAEPSLLDRQRSLVETPGFLSGKYSWFGDTDNFEDLVSQKVTLFICPSSELSEAESHSFIAVAGSQPANEETVHGIHDGYAWIGLTTAGSDTGLPAGVYDNVVSHQVFCGNYLGCAGAHCGGVTEDPEKLRFTGVMSSRAKVFQRDIKDGSSQTFLFGETIGRVEEGSLAMAQSFAFGGLGRIRGDVPWMLRIHPKYWQLKQLGDSQNSSAFGFGSNHKRVCNFSFADGSVRSIDREIDWLVLYQLAGMADGQTINVSEF